MKPYHSLFIILLVFVSCKETKTETAIIEEVVLEENVIETIEETTQTSFEVTPISHATMVLQWDGKVIYVDPVGGKDAFAGQPAPDIIVVTDIHGDHFNMETLAAVATNDTKIIMPRAVADKATVLQSQTMVLNNGETTTFSEFTGFSFEAIPMYNLREEALKFHPKGRGNGYVIEKSGHRVYISGDTEDIPEMRQLEDIDVAFVAMNLPYTMTVKNAASAVVDFKPKKVYPYHYRGADSFSHVGLFKTWIKKSSAWKDVTVVTLDWYPSKE